MCLTFMKSRGLSCPRKVWAKYFDWHWKLVKLYFLIFHVSCQDGICCCHFGLKDSRTLVSDNLFPCMLWHALPTLELPFLKDWNALGPLFEESRRGSCETCFWPGDSTVQWLGIARLRQLFLCPFGMLHGSVTPPTTTEEKNKKRTCWLTWTFGASHFPPRQGGWAASVNAAHKWCGKNRR